MMLMKSLIVKGMILALGKYLAGVNWKLALDTVITLASDESMTGSQKFAEVRRVVMSESKIVLNIVGELVVSLALNYAMVIGAVEYDGQKNIVAGHRVSDE